MTESPAKLVRRLRELKEPLHRYKMKLARCEGRIAEISKRMEEQFDVKTLEEANSLLKSMRAEYTKKYKKAHAMQEKVAHTFQDLQEKWDDAVSGGRFSDE